MGWLSLLASPSFGASDYKARFEVPWQKRDFPAMAQVLREWRTARPKDLELLVAYGDYFYSKGGQELEPLEGSLTVGGILLKKKPPRSLSGLVSPAVPRNLELLRQAGPCWKAALRSHPWRLDISLNLAFLYQALGDFEAQYAILADALQYADKHRSRLKWEREEGLPLASKTLLPEILQDFAGRYLLRERSSETEQAFRLARLNETFYPDYLETYNVMAAYFHFKKDGPFTLRCLLMAYEKNPKDSVILLNIANVLLGLRKKEPAVIFFRKVVELDNDRECVSRARKKLKKLGKTTINRRNAEAAEKT